MDAPKDEETSKRSHMPGGCQPEGKSGGLWLSAKEALGTTQDQQEPPHDLSVPKT